MSETYMIEGSGDIRFKQSEFVFQGGQGSVYVRGPVAYKIYTHPDKDMIPKGKINELSQLDRDFILRPMKVIYNGRNKEVGYTMPAAPKPPDSFPLITAVTKVFREREGLDEAKMFKLVQFLQDVIKFVHGKNFLVVDLNEMNFLLTRAFDKLYFADVDSYQTPNYPATALMESVRDRHSQKNKFSPETDWFSFGIVSFQMFVGIHPYKGAYDPFKQIPMNERLEQRMLKNISVLNPDVRVPGSVYPFSVIPDSYMQWFKAVLEEGKRLAPPDGTHVALVVPKVAVTRMAGSNNFDIQEFFELSHEVISVRGDFAVTPAGIYRHKRELMPVEDSKTRLVFPPPKSTPVAAFIENGRLRLTDVDTTKPIECQVSAESLMRVDERLYIKRGSQLHEVEFKNFGGRQLISTKPVANVMESATQLYEGAAIYSALGLWNAAIPYAPGKCSTQRLDELEEYQVIDAKHERNVLVVVGSKNGKYDRFVYRFSSDWKAFDVSVVPDVSYTGINFTVLDKGLVMLLNEQEELELFPNAPNSTVKKVIADPALSGIRLYSQAGQPMFARQNKVYKFNMRKP